MSNVYNASGISFVMFYIKIALVFEDKFENISRRSFRSRVLFACCVNTGGNNTGQEHPGFASDIFQKLKN